MKIWKMNDSDYVAANTLEEAKQCLADTIGDGVVNAAFEDEFIEDPVELSAQEMNECTFYDEDGSDTETSKRSFTAELKKRQLAGDKFPAHFASSEF